MVKLRTPPTKAVDIKTTTTSSSSSHQYSSLTKQVLTKNAVLLEKSLDSSSSILSSPTAGTKRGPSSPRSPVLSKELNYLLKETEYLGDSKRKRVSSGSSSSSTASSEKKKKETAVASPEKKKAAVTPKGGAKDRSPSRGRPRKSPEKSPSISDASSPSRSRQSRKGSPSIVKKKSPTKKSPGRKPSKASSAKKDSSRKRSISRSADKKKVSSSKKRRASASPLKSPAKQSPKKAKAGVTETVSKEKVKKVASPRKKKETSLVKKTSAKSSSPVAKVSGKKKLKATGAKKSKVVKMTSSAAKSILKTYAESQQSATPTTKVAPKRLRYPPSPQDSSSPIIILDSTKTSTPLAHNSQSSSLSTKKVTFSQSKESSPMLKIHKLEDSNFSGTLFKSFTRSRAAERSRKGEETLPSSLEETEISVLSSKEDRLEADDLENLSTKAQVSSSSEEDEIPSETEEDKSFMRCAIF